jgi:membrane protein
MAGDSSPSGESSPSGTQLGVAPGPGRGSPSGEAPGPRGATRAARPSRLPSWLRAWVQRFERSIAGHATQLLRDIVIIDKAMLMAAVSFISFVPLLIVLAAIFPVTEIHDFSGTLRAIMGLDADATQMVRTLFAPASRVARTTTVASLIIVIVSAYAFVANLQQTYELVWRKKRARRVQSFLRRWLWLAAFLVFGLVLALLHAALGGGTEQQVLANVVGFLLAACFFTWSMRLLLGGRVRWVELVPGGVATAIGQAGLRGFSMLFFSPMVVSNADAYGPIGVVFVLMSWLIGACVVLVGGPVVGVAISKRLFHHP